MFDSVRVANNVCRRCGYKLDGALGITTQFPEAGALSICINCAAVAIFNERGELRPPTTEELVEIKQDAKTTALLKKARRLIYGGKMQNQG